MKKSVNKRCFNLNEIESSYNPIVLIFIKISDDTRTILYTIHLYNYIIK